MSGFISTTTTMVIGAALLGLAAAGPAPANFNLHEWMTVEEIRQVFQTDPHTVPEYEVTTIQWPKLHKRAAENGIAEETATHIRLNAFGRNISLWLRPIDGILAGIDTPVYHARADENGTDGVRFDKIADPMSEVGRILEDKEKNATLAVKQATNGKQLVFGNIGSEQWIIRPVPIRYAHQNFSRYQRSVDDYYNVENATITDYEKPHYHVIYKTSAAPEGTKYASPLIGANLPDTKSSRSRRATIPSIIYPQILVIVDYASYQRHNGDTNAMLEYLLLFWNGVDLKYRDLEYPKIRINIAGVIIEADPNTLPYIKENKVTADKLDASGALSGSGAFRRKIESTFPLDSYDITVTLSPYNLCEENVTGSRSGTIGLTYLGGACRNYNWPYPHTQSVAVIRDRGGFDGVQAAAHELGHSFGAQHDGAPGVSCSKEVGNLMAETLRPSENSSVWSPCSLHAFDAFFRQEESVCLFNKPPSTSPMIRVLPGKIYSMDDQCMKLNGTKTCVNDPNLHPSLSAKYTKEICLTLKCYGKISTSNDLFCNTMGFPPADGTICGERMICLHGKCIREADVTH